MKIKELKNKRNFYFIIVMYLGLLQTINAQQYPQYTQYTYNMTIVNPAYAGSRNALSINMLGRTQWVGVEGAPKTGTLSIHSPVGLHENMGLGFSAIYDQVGPLKETHLYADISYTLDVSYSGKLAFGLKGGVSFQNLNQSLLNFNSSQSFTANLNNRTYPNFGFGMYYNEEKFYVGVSIPNILQTNFLNSESGLITETSKNSTFFIASGYVFEINDDIQLKPSFLVKYSSVLPTSFDLSATVFIQNKLELGTSYRLSESMSFVAALFVNDNLRIGYAYDYSVGNLSGYSNGSHEIMLLFDLPRKGKIVPKYY